MALQDELRQILETEEFETVGTAFAGTRRPAHISYSVATIRDWILAAAPFSRTSPIEQALHHASTVFSPQLLSLVVANLVRFSFLIELTNLTVGSTKMKTRWLPGTILMPQPNSFEPMQGTFEPGNDPRAATFDECARIFTKACNMVCDNISLDPSLGGLIQELHQFRRVPYEFPLSYQDPNQNPVHHASNIRWIVNDDLQWLLKARRFLRNAGGQAQAAIRNIEKSKLEVKIFKTDRALTGKDKTNRAKRWEVLPGDFQHATLEECWSAERKLTTDLVNFQEFPLPLKSEFLQQGLVESSAPLTRCPVTFAPLSFTELVEAILDPTHGKSQYQVGHRHPLKREGRHDGANICWQSADGNRIQGDLMIEETHQLLDEIAQRRAEFSSAC